ncbi:MAG: PQQ-dependent dehydrogenase, methanol/ethanol family [Gammaproteobacteria bacterium]|nr:PQQ-dependent dehydrogenase, methanol/ethanol family [Gammaproteobacteria bacterium]
MLSRQNITAIALLFANVCAPGAWAEEHDDHPVYSNVTQARLVAPEPENWLMYRRTYDSQGYSPLKQITRRNAKSLAPVWTFSTGMREAHQAPPVVNNGYMFITTPHNHLIALDARTGEQLWRYARELPEDQFQMHPTNRGVALWEDKVYMATADAFLVAIKASTGEVLWETEVEDYARGYYMTLAPLAASGKVMVGVSGGEFGIRGFVAAFDATTGEPAWKTYTIPGPGEKGHQSWPGDTWKTGGVPVWLTGSFDPELNLTYWGTGNGGPWMGDTRPGDNLYATSVIALDVDTGNMKAHHQYHWNDTWDWDEVSAPLLLNFERDGRSVPGLVHPGRNGYLWFLERKADAIGFVDAEPYVRQDVFTSLDSKTGRPTYDPDKIPGTLSPAEFCPSLWGGKDWPPAAYSPRTRLIYIPANENICGRLQGEEVVEYRPGEVFMGADDDDISLVLHPDSDKWIGELQAWNVDTGKKEWSTNFKSQNWGPVLATAGDVIFMGGTNDRYFRAFDARNGKILWAQRTNSGVVGVPSTYAVDGVQYVAVQSGWGVDAEREQASINALRGTNHQVPQGGVLWVFALR